jgi:hypothetical protein
MPDEREGGQKSGCLIREYLRVIEKYTPGNTRADFHPPAEIVRSEVYRDWWDIPDRKPKKVVLDRYIEWLDLHKPRVRGRSWRDLFLLQLTEFEHELRAYVSEPARPVETDLMSPKSPGKPTGDSKRKVEALAGLFQIVRPFVGDTKRLILEPLNIRSDGVGGALVEMFSHQHPSNEFRYEGDLVFSSLYASGLIKRLHESKSGFATRNISMFIGLKEMKGVYEKRNFMSGILLRGTSASTKKVQRMITAVPFIAIRVSDVPADLNEASFAPVQDRDTLYHVVDAMDCYVGTLTENCCDAFSKLRSALYQIYKSCNNDRVLKTMSPMDLSPTIADLIGSEGGDRWWGAIAKTIEGK